MTFMLLEHWKEYRAAICSTLIMIAAGNVIGWTSPTLPYLKDFEKSHIPLTSGEGSWITSIMILSSAFSAIPTAYFADIIGRKPCLLFGAVPYATGWILIILAKSKVELWIARVLGGIGYGIIYTAAPMYLGEISTDEIRGSLAILITIMNKLGILVEYCIGPYVSWTCLGLINLAVPVVFFLLFMWLPESPYFYVKKNAAASAAKSLRRLRNATETNAEMKKIESTVAQDMEEKGNFSDLFTNKNNVRALLLVIVLFATQQLCGSAAVIVYSQMIFDKADTSIRAEHASIIFGVVQLVIATLSFFLVDRLGRRSLLIFSSFGVFCMNMLIGAYFYLYRTDNFPSELRFLPIIFIVIYIIAYSVGLSTVPLAVTSELFPTNVKSYATSIVQIFVGVSTFAVQKLYQVISDEFGEYTTFWTFGVCSLVGLIVICFELPETKGQSFAHIQNQLRRRKKKNILNSKDCETPM